MVSAQSLAALAHHAQDKEKQVEQVQKEVDGAEDVLVGAEFLHHQLQIDNNKAAVNGKWERVTVG